jgi:glycosyltransferase involved in cell wall biosynthesis
VQVVGVDDASPDRCGEIFDDYARRDARMRVVHLDTNHGLGPARNAGLDASTGKYIWFVDADDVVATGAARAVLQRLREVRPDVLLLRHAWLVEGRTMADPHAPRVPRFPGVAAVTDRPALLRVRQAAWNRVVRRDLVEHPALRFPPG